MRDYEDLLRVRDSVHAYPAFLSPELEDIILFYHEPDARVVRIGVELVPHGPHYPVHGLEELLPELVLRGLEGLHEGLEGGCGAAVLQYFGLVFLEQLVPLPEVPEHLLPVQDLLAP